MIITKAQKFLLESDFILELLKQVPAAIFWKDANSVYLGCNNTFAYSLGLSSPQEVVGKTDYDLPTTKEESDAFRRDDKQVIHSKKPKLNIEEQQTLANGKKITLLTNKVPLFDKKNNVIGILGIYYDITERKRREEEELKISKEKAEAANKAKTEFLENMRHDIRTPLTGIIGFINLIKEEIKEPKLKEYIDNLNASSHALLELLNEVLEAIQVSSGEIPILKKKFELKTKLQQVVDLNQAKAHEKGLKLLFTHDNTIPRYLIGDSTRIHRIILELVNNALNFTNQGFIKLTTELAKNTARKLIIKIIVEDTGIGIASDKQQEIFVLFKRLTPSYEGIYKGTGLGLTIVKQFIDDLGGEIYVESKLGAGTKFTCIFSLKEALLDEPFGSEETPVQTTQKFTARTKEKTVIKNKNSLSSPHKNHILLVEDYEISAIVTKNILTQLNCQVDVAENGEIAIDLIKKNNYDLIFMDIGLPITDGYEITKRIRIYELRQGIHVPIIALTAHVGEENKQRCIEMGMNAVLNKPFTKKTAEDILDTFIPHRKKTVLKTPSNTPQLLPAAKIIDFALAKKMAGENSKNANKIIHMLVKSFPEEIKQLKAAYTQQDLSLLSALAHKLKGGCDYCGTTRLKIACANLEQAIKTGDHAVIENHYKKMLAEIHAIEKAVKDKSYLK